MGCFLGDDRMSKFLKEIIFYFGSVFLYILGDFIMYNGHINLKNYIVDAIIILIVCIIIKMIYTIIKKRKNEN